MSAETTKPLVYILLGLFLGVLIGIVATVAWTSTDEKETYADYQARTQPRAPSVGPQSPHGASPPTPPEQPAPGQDAGHGGGDRAEASFAKVHFMKKFVAAITGTPKNLIPARGYEPLLKEGAEPIQCADCHDPNSLNLEAMLQNDPGDEAVQPLRMQRRGFMIPLMTKWVERLNRLHAGRLKREITCTDCHEIDPRDPAAQEAIPPLMIRFVRALKEPPKNDNPAQGWKPLLKDPQAPAMLCSMCHGRVGASMEQNLARFEGPSPALAEYRPFMINLMERWVRELNRRAKDQLVKAVVCTDCHETDPRK